MSIGNNTPRLLAAAKEFNIGKETLIEFLKGKGFEIEGNKPNTKLSVEMYESLQAEFAKDKAVKRKSDSIALPKGAMMENLNKTQEQLDLSAKDKKEKKESEAETAKPKPEPEVAPTPAEVTVEIPEPELPQEEELPVSPAPEPTTPEPTATEET